MQSNQIRQAIKQLPIQQRAVAIALKNIYDQIKALTKKQQQDIDNNHLNFISKFKVLQKKASQIIQGKQIKQDELDTSDKFFTQAENPQKQKLMKNKNKIQNYWLRCVQNSEFGADLKQQQKQTLKHIIDLQTNITTNQIVLIITIQKNPIIKSGVFHRRLILDNGMAISFQGQQPFLLSNTPKQQGIFNTYILTNTKDSDQMNQVFMILGRFVNQIIPYSLEYYLGAVMNQQYEEEEDEDCEEEDDGENQQA